MSNEFSAFEIDVLKELINVGGGNVATTISKIFDKRVDMDVPVINLMTYEEIFENILPAEKIVKAVLIETTKDFQGQFLYVLQEDGLMEIAEKHIRSYSQSAEIADSAMCELANILVNSFINAITLFLEVETQSSVPYIAQDMFGSLLSSVYLENLQYADSVWIFKNDFWIEESKWESSLYFVPQNGVFEKLVETIM